MNSSSPKYIYVVLTQTGTLISRIIRIFTQAPYNHSSITTDKDLHDMFSFCRKHSHLPLPAGFYNEDIRTGVFSLFANIPCQIYEIKVTDEQYEAFHKIIDNFKINTKLYSYNLIGLVTMPLGIPLKRKTRFVCSQFVAYTLSQAGIANFDKDISLVTPNDFRYLENARLLYTGNIKHYSNNDMSEFEQLKQDA